MTGVCESPSLVLHFARPATKHVCLTQIPTCGLQPPRTLYLDVTEGSGGIPRDLDSAPFARKKMFLKWREPQWQQGRESSEAMQGILKVHRNRPVRSVCWVYKFCFCVVHDGNRSGSAGNSNSLFVNQGRICERTVVSRDLWSISNKVLIVVVVFLLLSFFFFNGWTLVYQVLRSSGPLNLPSLCVGRGR